MDASRRAVIASAAAAALDEAQRAIVDSWADLMPEAQTWAPDAQTRGLAACRAVLEAMVEQFAQGDLEERSLAGTLAVLAADGNSTPDEVAELLRTIRIVGVDRLLAIVDEAVGLTTDERWHLHQEAWSLSEQLRGQGQVVDDEAFDALIDELFRSGADER